ncbi:D-inositol 3-phosphate glycosyltransferase [mine drainage metagenome]|uniref:D-inositol 3-phosphate glycosyltransferase n=1 Tax=mine drainage metagenome TaxID=410659 RepID=A0A1J5TBB0_9ZZZZ
MKVIHYSGDSIGGAARAALRLHQAMQSNTEIQSSMVVRHKMNDDWRIAMHSENRLENFYGQIRPIIDRLPARLQHNAQIVPRSPAWLSAISAKEMNQTDADVINLHWICSGFLSIEEIGKITKPVVWTLHDMWPFCGAEHLAEDADQARWRVGYTQASRNPQDRWIDIDRWVWRRKQKAWKRPMHIVTPSRWLAECARSSALMRNWEITVVPNVLDTNRYKPIQKSLAREVLGLPLNAKLILFGAIRGTQLSYKGWDLLQPALAHIAEHIPNAHAIIFGQGAPKNPPSLGMPLHWMGHLHDDATLALLYGAADVMVVPSRQESFCQTASEAHACGCPVVAFNVTGLRDVVEHGQTGYLAEPYSSEDLAKGIEWVLADDGRHARLSAQARERAVRLWSHEAVVPQYLEVYQRVMEVPGG